MKNTKIVGAVLGILILIALGFFVWHFSEKKDLEGTVCTAEAKLCSDGSYVGRQGPMCEFATCPSIPSYEETKLKTGTISGISFMYPETLGTKYIQTSLWPPAVRIASSTYECVTASNEEGVVTEEIAVLGRPYCRTITGEGAAGSTYRSYEYTFVYEKRLLTVEFALRYPQCMNYNVPERDTCLSEQKSFSPNLLADSIAKSLQGGLACGPNCKDDMIKLTYPLEGDTIRSPITIKGEARGMWYFEATFPVTLTDWDGKIIAEGYAQADGDWMTENYVPFTARLTYKASDIKNAPSKRGTLILKKDNPSGLPQYDNALEIQVVLQ